MGLTVWQVDPTHLTPYYNLALCSALAQWGCDVHYATSDFLYDTALLYPTDFQTHFLYFPQNDRSKPLYAPSAQRVLKMLLYPIGHYRFLRALEVNQPAIVHMQWTRLPHIDLCLIAKLHQHGIPVIYTAHDIKPLFSYAFDLSKIYTAVDAIIVHTDANREKLIQSYPHLSKKTIRVITHLAPEWIIPSGANRVAARSLLGIAADAPVLLFFGSNRPYKGLDVLVEAFARVSEVRPDIWLVVVGRLADSCAFPSLRKSGILVDPEYIPSDRVWIYHLAADIAVLPYLQISQSGELITAMSFGLPVITTDAGGMRETINGNGWVVPANNPEALAQAIIDAFSDTSQLEALGNRSLQLIHRSYSPVHVAQQTLALYNEIIQCYNASSTVPIV